MGLNREILIKAFLPIFNLTPQYRGGDSTIYHMITLQMNRAFASPCK